MLTNYQLYDYIQLEHEKAAYDNEKYEMKAEIKRNEELMEVMDKRFDEQHAKIMVSQK